jgi:hypothetical protein
MTQAKATPVATRHTVGAPRRPASRHLGDTQSVFVGFLSIAVTAIAMWDLFLLTLIAR